MELRTNSTFDELIRDRLFTPLGMERCGLGPLPESNNTSLDSPWPHIRNNDSAQTPIPFDSEALPLEFSDNPSAYEPAGAVHCPLASYLRYLQLHINGSLGLSIPETFSGLKTEDFRYLHAPYRPYDGRASSFSYTPGGWLGSSDTQNFVKSSGTNTFNYMMVFVRAGAREAGVVATNIGSGGDETDPVGVAMSGILDQMMEGQISLLA